MPVLYSFKRRLSTTLLKLFDLAVLAGALMVPVWFFDNRFDLRSATPPFSVHLNLLNGILFVVLVVIFHLIFLRLRIYDSKRLTPLALEAVDICIAVILCTIVLLVAQSLFKDNPIAAYPVQYFLLLSSVSLLSMRIVLRYWLRLLHRHGRNIRHMVVVGTNRRAFDYFNTLVHDGSLGYVCDGFVDSAVLDKNTFAATPAAPGVIANFSTFIQYLRGHIIDEVFICLPIKTYYDRIDNIIHTCEEQGVVVRFFLDIFNPAISRPMVDRIDNQSILTFVAGDMYKPSIIFKEIMDIAIASSVMVITAPVMLLAAVIIKTTSPGPVFFKQDRIGLNKRIFKIYKFRTMIRDAEKQLATLERFNEVVHGKGAFKIKNDPRITAIGRILRKYSIDELPQLFNVLMGDMSIVGPRPLTMRDFAGFDVDWQRRRFSVKPGVTGLWQVSGRHKISFDQWMRMDMEYIDRWSLGLDMKILFKTIPAVITGSGAS